MLVKFDSEEGFTLLETLIALVILGISISILVEAYLIVTDSIEYQRNYNFVLNWSDGKMNELINGIELARHGSFEYLEKSFQWSVEEGFLDNNFKNIEEKNGLKTIELTVKWQSANSVKDYRTTRVVLID